MAKFTASLAKVKEQMQSNFSCEGYEEGTTIINASIGELQPNPLNKTDETYNLEELAFSISQNGIMHNFVAMEKPNGESGYILLSGHRRRRAILMNIEKGLADENQEYPVLVYPYMNEEEQNFRINIANDQRRTSEVQERNRIMEVLEYVDKRIEAGALKYEGHYRDYVAKMIGSNPTAVQRMSTIKKKAIPEVVESVLSGDFSVIDAVDIARKPTEEQEQIVDTYKKTGKIDIPSAKKDKPQKESVTDTIAETVSEEKKQPEEEQQEHESEIVSEKAENNNFPLNNSEIRLTLNIILDELPICGEESRNILNGMRMRIDNIFSKEPSEIRKRYLETDELEADEEEEK